MHPFCLVCLGIQFAPPSSTKPFCSFILKFLELPDVAHLDVLDGLPAVQRVKAGEVSWLLDDGLVSVQGTRDCVGPTRTVTSDIASVEAHVTGTHVMRVGDPQVVVKPDTRHVRVIYAMQRM